MADNNNNNFYGRVLGAICELKAPKSQTSTFGKYKYRSCEDILEAVKPILKKYSLILNLADEVIFIDGRHYIKATATLIDATSGVINIKSTAYAREPDEKKGMDDSQITGTASSYARKYALNGLFCIDDTKDADTDEYANQTAQAKKNETKTATVPKQTPAQTKDVTISPTNTVICENEGCGCAITPETIKGKVYNVDTIVKASMNKYGKVLCKACRDKIEADKIIEKGVQL
ncbi:MAG: ERF family protein [Clostridia bacterium]|nr:ERF family protein [Clostridia bacterium]